MAQIVKFDLASISTLQYNCREGWVFSMSTFAKS